MIRGAHVYRVYLAGGGEAGVQAGCIGAVTQWITGGGEWHISRQDAARWIRRMRALGANVVRDRAS